MLCEAALVDIDNYDRQLLPIPRFHDVKGVEQRCAQYFERDRLKNPE